MGAVGKFFRLESAIHNPDRLVGELGDGTVHQGHVHIAALARPLGFPQGGQHTRNREKTARIVHKTHSRLGGRPPRLTGHAHDPRVGLHQKIVGRLGGPRAGCAESGEKAAHDLLVERTQVFVGELEFFGLGSLAVDDHGVGPGHHLPEQLIPFGGADIQRYALFIPVKALKVIAVVARKRIGRHRPGGVSADFVVFDFDDLGPHVRQQHGPHRPGPELLDRQHPEPLKGPGATHGLPPARWRGGKYLIRGWPPPGASLGPAQEPPLKQGKISEFWLSAAVCIFSSS